MESSLPIEPPLTARYVVPRSKILLRFRNPERPGGLAFRILLVRFRRWVSHRISLLSVGERINHFLARAGSGLIPAVGRSYPPGGCENRMLLSFSLRRKTWEPGASYRMSCKRPSKR